MATAPDPTATADGTLPPRPPFVRRVRIRNYKSIAFCDLTLEPLTILVGRNASGKSNFLDALGFLRDVATVGVREAVRAHGGRDAVLYRGAAEPVVSIEIEGAFGHSGAGEEATEEAAFRLDVGLPADRAPEIRCERFTLGDDPRGPDGYSACGDDITRYDDDPGGRRLPWRNHLTPILTRWNKDSGLGYLSALLGVRHYGFDPSRIRPPQAPRPGEYLTRDGANLASVLRSIRDADPFWFDRINAYLRSVTPDIQVDRVEQVGGYETIQFRVGDEDSDRPLTLPAASMSDGTLRVLAALTAAIQDFPPDGPPSLVAIEEPETSLHPAAMRSLVAALDEATLRTQILITTHSPDLLDAEEVKPENVRVVRMVDGKTVIGPVDEAFVEIVAREFNTLAGLERESRLEPDLDDIDRQKRLEEETRGPGA